MEKLFQKLEKNYSLALQSHQSQRSQQQPFITTIECLIE